jgi:hypothetical protein
MDQPTQELHIGTAGVQQAAAGAPHSASGEVPAMIRGACPVHANPQASNARSPGSKQKAARDALGWTPAVALTLASRDLA